MKIIDYDNIIEQITKKNRVSRIILLFIGAFIVALIYNAFIVPNSIVYGGVGGIAIVISKYTGIETTLLINILTAILALISIFIIGLKNTSYSIFGFLAYALMINLTSPIAPYFQFEFDSHLLSILFYACISGVGSGLIYKCGFNTGGADSIIAMAQKYFQFTTSKLSNIINGMIIIAGALTFGIQKSIYAIIYLKIINFFSERTIVGVSTNKLCFIKSNKIGDIEGLLNKELEVGYTLIESTNGVGLLKKNIIMCVVPTDRFYDLKHELINIDSNAKIISNDCYTVVGGKINKLINVNH